MPSMQEQIAEQAWELFLRFAGTGAEFIYNITHEGGVMLRHGGDFTKELLLALINKAKENGEGVGPYQMFEARANKGETLNNMFVAEEEVDELKTYLMRDNIPFIISDNPRDDSQIFLYMSGDAQRVANTISLWQADRGLLSELNPDLFLENYATEEVGTVLDVDMVEMEMFRHYAKDNGLAFASCQLDSEDKHMIVYNPADKSKVTKALAEATLALTGAEGARVRQQMVFYLRNRQKISATLLDLEQEHYIVNAKDPANYIHVTSDGFKYYKNDQEVFSVDRNRPDFLERGLRIIEGMSQPVLLNKGEFEKKNEQGELDKQAIALTVSQKASMIPDRDQIKELQQKQNDRLNLIQEKMALDDEGQAAFWLYDDSISYSNAGTFEGFDDLDDQTKEDMRAVQEKMKSYSFNESRNDRNSLDHFIEEAEKKRDPRSVPQREEQRTM